MNKIFTALVFLAPTLFSTIYAQQDTATAKEYEFKEVVVTGIRTDWQIYETGRIRELFDDRLVGAIQHSSLAGVLYRATGLEIKDYGSAHALKTLSLRGSTAEQITILLNGVPVRSPASGVMDLSLIPMDHVKLIEVDRGGGFAAQGHSAIGGTIVLNTAPQYPLKSFYNEVLVAITTFDQRRIQWINHWNIADWQTATSFSRDFLPDSSYQVNDPYSGKKVFRVHSRSGRSSVTNQIHRHSGNVQLSLTHIYTARKSQIPNTIGNNTASLSRATQNDRLWILQPVVDYRQDPRRHLKLTGSYQYTSLIYRNPPAVLRSDIRTGDYYINAESEQQWSPFYRTVTGITGMKSHARGKMLKNADEQMLSGYTQQTLIFPVYFLRIVDRLSMYPAVRYDYDPSHTDQVTAQVSVVFGKYMENATYLLKFLSGNHYRKPTLNERYWNGDGAKGNPDLKPERSFNLNTGLTGIHEMGTAGTIQNELNLFLNRSRNQIVWESGVLKPGVISPLNLRETRSAGWEWMATYVKDSLTCRVSMVRTLAEETKLKKRIPYSPLYAFRISAQWSTEKLLISQTTRYHSERFVHLQNSRYLKPYWITDLMLQYRTTWQEAQIFIFANLQNLWDVAYEPVALYPGPSRVFEIGVKIGY